MKQITLTLDDGTASALAVSGVKLLAWKSIGNSDRATKPLIWSVSQSVYQLNYVSYGPSFSAYRAASTVITEATVILPNSYYPIDTGQTLALTANGGAKVVNGGTAGAVTVTSANTVSYVCGLSQAEGSSSSIVPYCAATIYPGFEETFYPVDKVLLAFSSADLVEGEYIAALAGSPSARLNAASSDRAEAITGSSMLLVDLTAADCRTVRYSFDKGWSIDLWSKTYPADTSLSSILIQGDGLS